MPEIVRDILEAEIKNRQIRLAEFASDLEHYESKVRDYRTGIARLRDEIVQLQGALDMALSHV